MISSEDYNFLFIHQLNGFTEEIGQVLVGCEVALDRRNGILLTHVPVERVDKVRCYSKAILTQAHLKLGCVQLSIYCCGDNLINYNLEGSDMKSDMTVELREREEQKNVEWLSFESLARLLEISIKQLEDKIEAFGVKVQRKSGEWGLSIESLEDFLDLYFDEKKIDVLNSFKEVASIEEKEGVESIVASEIPVEETNGHRKEERVESNTLAISMKLSSSFGLIQKDRVRRPSPKIGLQMALASLEEGKKGEAKYLSYLEEIVNKTAEGNTFVKDLSQLFADSKKAAVEIKKAAKELWEQRGE